MFLADRLRGVLLQLGREVADEDHDELDLHALDTVSKAGVRFERILKRLAKETDVKVDEVLLTDVAVQ